MATKTVYHSELKKLSPVRVTVKSEILESTKKKGSYYVVLEIDGTERYYNPENQACLDFWEGQKGRTFTLIAEGGGKGKEDSATLQYVGEAATADNPPKPSAKPAPRPAPHPAPAPRHTTAAAPGAHAPSPQRPAQPQGGAQLGARVGMAINKAVDSCIQEGIPWNPMEIMNRASDLCRIAQALENGHLQPKFSERQQATGDN